MTGILSLPMSHALPGKAVNLHWKQISVGFYKFLFYYFLKNVSLRSREKVVKMKKPM